MSYMIGVDVGGTFTDFSFFNIETGALRHYKRSSTPEDPSKAIMGGIQEILSRALIPGRLPIWPMELRSPPMR